MKRFFFSMLTLALLSGCASIFSGSTQTVSFRTDPEGATVEGADQTCVTPCSLTLPRGGNSSVTVTKTGYLTQKITPVREFNSVSLWNILFLPGFIVDLATGAIHKMSPDDMTTGLQKTAE
jgi:uncharacterized protein YceK